MSFESGPLLSGDDRASATLRRGREIAERVRSGIGCTDREYRFLAALYELSATMRAEDAPALAGC